MRLAKGKYNKRCRWGFVCESSEANNVQVSDVRSLGNLTVGNGTDSCNGTISCDNSPYQWISMRSLQLNSSNTGNIDFFKEKCFNQTVEESSCRESCDGVYRTFTGCCNNL